ncbi:hypothetical protein [Streptosporangium subroseum]|uniref:hypothetical protein n=1 Tax=Streptosporangium subroseum TaxID=106412 RepID=UPI003088CFE5|nr:hypothetical protein OHB15_09670 [Streptosporangium subroseum]
MITASATVIVTTWPGVAPTSRSAARRRSRRATVSRAAEHQQRHHHEDARDQPECLVRSRVGRRLSGEIGDLRAPGAPVVGRPGGHHRGVRRLASDRDELAGMDQRLVADRSADPPGEPVGELVGRKPPGELGQRRGEPDLPRRGKAVQAGRRGRPRLQRRQVHDGDLPVAHVVLAHDLNRHGLPGDRDRVAPRPPVGPPLEGDVERHGEEQQRGGDGHRHHGQPRAHQATAPTTAQQPPGQAHQPAHSVTPGKAGVAVFLVTSWPDAG